jgi:hypothetical protein
MPSQGYERVSCLLLTCPGPTRADAPLRPWPRQPYGRANMSTQVAVNDDDDSPQTSNSLSAQQWPPASPPPSFHSRASSPTTRRLLAEDPESTNEDRTLADTFDSDSDDDDDQRPGFRGESPSCPYSTRRRPPVGVSTVAETGVCGRT